MRPKTIMLFELLILTTLVIGLVNSFLLIDESLKIASLSFVLIVQGGTFAIMTLLTLFVSRRRSKVAMWISILLFLFGLPLYLKMIGEGTIEPSIVQLVQLVLQTIAFALLFAPSSRRWMNRQDENSH